MRDQIAIALLVVLVIASASAGYYLGNSNEHTTTSTTTSTVPQPTTTTLTVTGNLTSPTFASVAIVNATVPASAWSRYSENVLQCGYAQPAGSGSITLSNKGNGPTTVEDLIIYLGYTNQTAYLAATGQPAQECTVSPSGSLTLYFSFSFSGSGPTKGEYFACYLWLGNDYAVGFSGTIT